MTDEATPASSNVVPLGRDQFFAVDRRAWAKACDLGINAAIAYLVMARGTGHDMRSTSWSAKAIQERTSVPWRQCKAAIQAVVASGLVRQDKGGQQPPLHRDAGPRGSWMRSWGETTSALRCGDAPRRKAG